METLGAITTICSDKTGTLTQNRMTVSHVVVGHALYPVSTDPAHAGRHETLPRETDKDTLYSLFLVGVLCNRATFKPDQPDDVPVLRRETIGDASESAILKFITETNADHNPADGSLILAERAAYPKVAEIPFNSTNKYQVSIHMAPDDDRFLLVMKGAPERILERCSQIRDGGLVWAMTDDDRKRIEANNAALGEMGERVLALCSLRLSLVDFLPGFKFESSPPNFPLRDLAGFCR